jgi:hypothetical protein
LLGARVQSKNFSKKYNRFTMEHARQLQCKALRRLEKIRQRNNNGEQWKNNAQNNGNCRISGRVLTRRLVISHRTKTIARRRGAPGAHFQD